MRADAAVNEAIAVPAFSAGAARQVAAEHFGIDGEAVELPSHQDRNFLITAHDGRRAVLKVANPEFGRASLELQNAAMSHVAAAGLPFETPAVLPTVSGEELATVSHAGVALDVRLVSHLDGTPLSDTRHLSRDVRAGIGAIAGLVASALAELDHPAADRELQWDVSRARAVVDGLGRFVCDRLRRALVERAMAVHDDALAAVRGELRVQVIHGDVTTYNVLGRRDRAGRLRATGLIDFGDVVRSYLVAEPAVVIADAAAAGDGVLQAIGEIAAGFHAQRELTEPELAALFPLSLARAAASAVSGAAQAAREPGNDYVVGSTEVCWSRLAALAAIPPGVVEAVCRAACGFEAHPHAAAVRRFLGSASPAPLVELAGRRMVPVDLGVGSERRADGGLPAGELAVGRWGEARIVDEAPSATEPASIHLGADVFADAGEPVRAPLAGVAERRGAGELLLRHEPAGAPRFWTRLAGLRPNVADGAAVEAGSEVGTVAPGPASLHVQLALAPLEPLPRFALASLRAAWVGLCPDPSALLGVDAAAPHRDAQALLALRDRSVAKAQRVFFARPPEIVRGWRQYLYDADGRPYLDMINNVAVLGHSHPRVAEAAYRQLRLVNSNSRFLHASLARFAARLAALLPPPLDAVFVLNSGSEANDLALRLARSHTGREPVIALDGAYHGWTAATAAISSSPYDVPDAAAERPAGLRVVPAPNAYRGAYPADDPDAGARYAEHVREAAGGAAAFICEPQLGNAGGVLPPPGYLQAAYGHVRAAGGVCIADEVQVGYGRLGRWFWAFEQQEAVPDIVTIAKPAGNGHPLGAVITTPEIAAALRPRTSLFSSAGGSPVSCEIGLAVLDAIEEEDLQGNARRVGDHLRARLAALMQAHDLIGAVHGAGLHLGVELVRDRVTKEPAAEEASALCERMLELGVIVQPTGELGNVLKVKPPLCVTHEDADRFAGTLDRVLSEGW